MILFYATSISFTLCYGLNVMSHQDFYVKAQTPNVMVFESGAFGK